MLLREIIWKGFLTHVGLHFADAGAITVFRQYGDTLFRGISRAKTEFVPFGQNGVDWRVVMRQGYIPVGIWDSPFDDHGLNLPGVHCEASLAADFVGMPATSPLHSMIGYALLVDKARRFDFRRMTGAPFFYHYGAMMKQSANNGAPDEDSLHYMKNLILAEGEMRHLPAETHVRPENKVKSFSQFMADWLKEQHVNFGGLQPKMEAYATYFAGEKSLRPDEYGHHPAALFYRMQRCTALTPETRQEVFAAMRYFFHQQVEAQIQFEAARRAALVALRRDLRQINGVKLLCLRNSNRYLQQALRFLNAFGVLVQFDTQSNNASIFCSESGLDFPEFLAAVRRLELERTGKPVEGVDLKKVGDVAGWYWLNDEETYLLRRAPQPTALDHRDFLKILKETTEVPA